MKKHVWGATAAIVMSATSSVQAATISNISPFDLSATIKFFQPLGQSFTALDPYLLSIGFQFDNANPLMQNAPVQIELRAGSGLSGTTIATRSLTLPDVFPRQVVDMDFSGTTLRVGDVYKGPVFPEFVTTTLAGGEKLKPNVLPQSYL